MLVCIPCRDAQPTLNLYKGEYVHACGERVTLSPRNWSPPKKSNTRAWKRIENGEWLWDRRRVRRNPPNAAHYKSSWLRLPTHKKGQRGVFQTNTPRKNGPDIDLGG